MDDAAVEEGDFGVDLEAGVIGSAEVGLLRDPVLDVRHQGRLCHADCGVEDKATHFVCCFNERTTIGAAVTLTAKGSETGETLGSVEKACKENRKKSSNKKASKPPRPPRSPSLDAADQKLIKEIAELAMLKRARIERMKALKKEKNAKAASSALSGNAFALVLTVLFIFIILFQGCSPSTKLSVAKFEGSPESAGLLDKGAISVHHDLSLLASYENGLSYGTPSSTEQVNDGKLPRKLNAILW